MAPHVQPGNPLWLEWIEAQVRVYEEKGTDARFHWSKAATSFRKCPKTFSHPSEAIELKGIGKGTIDFLCRKLKAHCEATGEPFPDPVGPPRLSPAKKRAAGAPQPVPGVGGDDDEDLEKAARRCRLLGLPENPQAPVAASAPQPAAVKPASKARKERPYVPAKGSGPYAILIGLYKLSSPDEMDTPVLKSELVDQAQEYTTTSFTKAKAGESSSAFHTAWSSMTTLINKNLVTADNRRPQRYALTEAGYRLAEQVASTAGVALHPPSRLPPRAGPSNEVQQPRAPKYATTAATGFAHAPARPAHNIQEMDYERQLELALELSMKESAPPSSSGAEPNRAGPSSDARRIAMPVPRSMDRGGGLALSSSPFHAGGAGMSRPALDGRKAASGFYAAHSGGPAAAAPPGNVDTVFGFFYLDPDDNRSLNKDDAEQGMEEGILSPIYRIEYRMAQDLHKMANSILRKSVLVRAEALPGGKTMSGFIRERIAIDKAPGFPTGTTKSTTSNMDKGKGKETAALPIPRADPFNSLMAGYKAPVRKAKDAMYAMPVEVERRRAEAARSAEARMTGSNSAAVAGAVASTSASTNAHPMPAALEQPVAASSPVPLPVRAQTFGGLSAAPTAARPVASSSTAAPVRTVSAPALRTASSSSAATMTHLRPGVVVPVAFADSPVDVIVNRHPLDPIRDNVSSVNFVPTHFEPRLFRPGTFKIVLIVDTREKGRTSDDAFVRTLASEGVDVDKKMLALGDMIWVARPVNPDGQPTGEDDVVLDAIVERKRLDDLCKSILDNRYLTQKIRMRDSGISQRIYLIEKYDAHAQYSQWGKQIWTSKSQLQVNDGFFVYESKSFHDTIKWLKMRTRIMKEIHENTTLYVIPNKMIDRRTYLPLQAHLHKTQPATRYLTTYSMFEELNKSDSALTIRSQWASMVQRINGVSAEKTVQFVERWPTPKMFWDETKKHRQEFGSETGGNVEGGVGGGGGKSKKRKIEDFVIDNLPDIGQRGIKGKVGSRIWALFASENYEAGQI
ncbi:hypothetical protein ACM66B_003710 [Microbotryomycetes sp. NB124-2]